MSISNRCFKIYRLESQNIDPFYYRSNTRGFEIILIPKGVGVFSINFKMSDTFSDTFVKADFYVFESDKNFAFCSEKQIDLVPKESIFWVSSRYCRLSSFDTKSYRYPCLGGGQNLVSYAQYRIIEAFCFCIQVSSEVENPWMAKLLSSIVGTKIEARLLNRAIALNI